MRTQNIYTGAIVLLAFAGPSMAAVEIAACRSDENVPETVAVALDSVLMSLTDPDASTSTVFGYAPGGVLSVKAPDWRYARAAGTIDIERGEPISCDTPFQIGSNTKMMTATVLMQMVEEGSISLDDMLSKHLPDIAQRLENGDAITLRQLATHTSGVFSYTDNAPDGSPGIMEGDLTDPDALRRGFEPEQLVDWVIEHGEPTFSPGEDGKWAYSNTGYVLLGMIIEKIEGRTLAESFSARIFDPLGMTETIFWNDIPNDELGLPHAYFQAPFDIETTDWNMSQAWAAGAVISTTNDMHIFIEALLGGELFTTDDTLLVMQQTVPTDYPTIYGYGIGLADKGFGSWGHGGQTLGYESDVAYFAGAEISFVGWGNSANNIMSFGVDAVSSALSDSAMLPDPNAATEDELRATMLHSEWQLISVKVGDGPVAPAEDPTANTVAFLDDGHVSIKADCNRIQGRWALDGSQVQITMGAASLALCPQGSLGETFAEWLGNASSVSVTGNELTIVSIQGADTASLTFRSLNQ